MLHEIHGERTICFGHAKGKAYPHLKGEHVTISQAWLLYIKVKLCKLESHFCVISGLVRIFSEHLSHERPGSASLLNLNCAHRSSKTSDLSAMMNRQCMHLLFILIVARYVLSEKKEHSEASEIPRKKANEDRLLANIIRSKNSSTILHPKSDVDGGNDKNADKKPRTVNRGSPYGSGSSSRPDSTYSRPTSDGGRFPPHYGDRLHVDRFGWQTQGRPQSGSTGRPGSYGGTYSGNGVYAGNQAGDRYSPRPVYGAENSGRPGGLGHGSGGGGGYSYSDPGYGGHGSSRPTGYGGAVGSGSYGVTGTFADGDEFGPEDPNFPEGGGPPPPENIQTQKAVALKALAGVALIGAAAALATNPVLLPIGLVAGRRKRSELSYVEDDPQTDYVLKLLRNYSKVQVNGSSRRLIISPRCVLRLSCEMQRKYMKDLKRNVDVFKGNQEWERSITNLIRDDVRSIDSANSSVRKLIRIGVGVASKSGNCDIFTCNFIKNR
ncbi:hypothetical protein KM043_008209 [Ampulex compressa]|nr:hypothetical protein KM043_008209 [Ampulex compressa]